MIFSKIQLGAMLVMAALLLGLGLYTRHLVAQNGEHVMEITQLKEDIADWASTVKELDKELQERDKLLTKVEAERQVLRTEFNVWKRRYEDALRKDPSSRAWSEQPVPSAVADLLRERAPKN